ncbi:MAG TPA: hypothetical protein ENN20_02445 [Candidatus Marinimicrobia bacterium]|nr:hypothetical protein [Candidatus Neomarinimicrobiota bacterium]
MKTLKYLSGSLVFLMIFQIYTANAQTFLNFQIHGSYTDNIFQNYTPTEDYISSGNFTIYHQSKSKTIFYYNGNLNLFSKYSDLQNQNHHLGISKKQSIGDSKNEMYFGGYARFRIDKPVYEIYDNNNYYGFASIKYYLFPTILFRAKNTLGMRAYVNYTDYSYFENVLSLNISKFFQTRTTLQSGIDYFYKDYAEDQTYSVTSPSGLRTRTYVIDSPKVSQLLASLKIAQSISSLTAVQAQYLIRNTLSGENRFAELDEFYIDEVLFDDHYSYSGQELSMSLKQFLPFQFIAVLSGYYQEKSYNHRPVYDLEGNELTEAGTRQDYQNGFSIQLEKKFSGEKIPVLKSLDLFLNYSYRKNHSNDPYYKAATNFLMFGLETNI